MLTSKGAAGVTGSGFITLAATLCRHRAPSPSPASPCCSASTASCREARALTNLIGNGVATIVVAKWTGDLDETMLTSRLKSGPPAPAEEPAPVS